MADQFDDDDDAINLDDYPTLLATAQFLKTIPTISWFENIGAPLDANLELDAHAYLDALGFPDAAIAAVGGWEDAAYAIGNPDWNSDWWETEEQVRAGLTTAALETVGEEDLEAAIAHLNEIMTDIIPEVIRVSAVYGGVSDDDVIMAAVGAATQACHVAALVVLAAEEEDHSMALKFRLFEAGRWPLGVTGNSFHLF